MGDMKCNIVEMEGGSIAGEVYKTWYHGLSAPDKKEGESMEMLYVNMEPKVKWFRPPFSIRIFKWEISFMWAYKIHKAYLLKNVQPVAVNRNDNSDTEISFKAHPFSNEKINQMAEELSTVYTEILGGYHEKQKSNE